MHQILQAFHRLTAFLGDVFEKRRQTTRAVRYKGVKLAISAANGAYMGRLFLRALGPLATVAARFLSSHRKALGRRALYCVGWTTLHSVL